MLIYKEFILQINNIMNKYNIIIIIFIIYLIQYLNEANIKKNPTLEEMVYKII